MAQTPDLKEQITRFLEHLEIEKNSSKLTVAKYGQHLMSLCEYLEGRLGRAPILADVDIDNIRTYRLFLSRKKGISGNLKSVTQAYYVIALRSFLKWLVKNDYNVMRPEKIDVPKQRDKSLKFLEANQIEHLLNQPLLSSKSGLRDRAIMEVLFSTGLRVSELVGLDREKIDLGRREFGVIGKGGKSRLVFLTKRAADWLDRYLHSRLDDDKAVFIRIGKKKNDELSPALSDEKSLRLTARSVQNIVKKYVKSAKLPVEATPHTLRHSMATDMLRAGADIRSIQELLGHKNISTTQVYTHVTDASLRETFEKFHRGNK